MSCNKKLNIEIPTTKRCNEMIDRFEKMINDKFKTNAKYSKDERLELINEIKLNPTHLWEVGDKSLMHYELKHLLNNEQNQRNRTT